ncbi:MAG: NAD-dependent epimerase/dehydratase family protein [Anaerolineales bacterium]|nr:NAD-dependent epimerase/dehydratase family protein [Chloroflexota bacterium]MBL6980737.1 NAD-dependent epimerase/dehydratase family protein [Anaerolineales bacterium]
MKKILLTGGTGFVGSNLARRLLQDGHILHLFVRPGYKSWRIDQIEEDLIFHEVDLLNYDQVSKKVKQIGPDWVFHLATRGAYSWQDDVHDIVYTNVNGTVNLLEAVIRTGFEIFINTGSSSEYGEKDHAPLETEYLNPNSYYAATKAFNTHYCKYVGSSKNLNIITFRLYSVFGPYEDPRRFIPTLIRYGLNGKLPPLVDPEIARDFIHIDDVLDLYLLAANTLEAAPGSIYNVGTGKQTTIRDSVSVARKLMGIEVEPKWSSHENRKWDTNNWVANISLVKSKFNWYPNLDFATGFSRTLKWFQENPKYLYQI